MDGRLPAQHGRPLQVAAPHAREDGRSADRIERERPGLHHDRACARPYFFIEMREQLNG